MAILTNPNIYIDTIFMVNKKCSYLPNVYSEGDVTVQDFVGGLHVQSNFRKELFQLQFLELSEIQEGILERLVTQTGVNIFHTVKCISPEMVRLWDGSTAWTFGLNSDIQRVRNKVYINKFSKERIPGNPNRYKITLTCQET